MQEPIPTYSPAKPPLPESPDQLRARIPGWGADLDPRDRPSVPRLQSFEGRTGAHWEFPDRQSEDRPRERSMEHAFLTPVFGTAQPLHGVSGRIRRLAYERFSEARSAHWLLLMAGDRVEVLGSTMRSLATRRPDDPITESGVRAELSGGAFRSRADARRADLRHQLLDPVVVLGPWVAAGWAAGRLVGGVLRRVRRA